MTSPYLDRKAKSSSQGLTPDRFSGNEVRSKERIILPVSRNINNFSYLFHFNAIFIRICNQVTSSIVWGLHATRSPLRVGELALRDDSKRRRRWFCLVSPRIFIFPCTGYWPSVRSRWLDICQVLFLRVYAGFRTETKSRSINTQNEKKTILYPATLTEQAWSIKDLLYGITPKRDKFSLRDKACITSLAPSRVANQSARFGACPFTYHLEERGPWERGMVFWIWPQTALWYFDYYCCFIKQSELVLGLLETVRNYSSHKIYSTRNFL